MARYTIRYDTIRYAIIAMKGLGRRLAAPRKNLVLDQDSSSISSASGFKMQSPGRNRRRLFASKSHVRNNMEVGNDSIISNSSVESLGGLFDNSTTSISNDDVQSLQKLLQDTQAELEYYKRTTSIQVLQEKIPSMQRERAEAQSIIATVLVGL